MTGGRTGCVRVSAGEEASLYWFSFAGAIKWEHGRVVGTAFEQSPSLSGGGPDWTATWALLRYHHNPNRVRCQLASQAFASYPSILRPPYVLTQPLMPPVMTKDRMLVSPASLMKSCIQAAHLGPRPFDEPARSELKNGVIWQYPRRYMTNHSRKSPS